MAADVIKSIAIKDLDVSGAVEANGTSGTPSFTNIEPAGIGTDTVAKWLKVRDQGVTYYIPMWT